MLLHPSSQLTKMKERLTKQIDFEASFHLFKKLLGSYCHHFAVFYSFLRILSKISNLLGASPTGIFQIRNTWKFIISLLFIQLLTNMIGKDWYFVPSFPVLERHFLCESLHQHVTLPLWGKKEQFQPWTGPSPQMAGRRRGTHSRDHLRGTQRAKSLGKYYGELTQSWEKTTCFVSRISSN